MWRRATDKLALLLVAGVVLFGAACILGPKQDDPDSLPTTEDAGAALDTAKEQPPSDTGTMGIDAAASDTPPAPPDDRCGDDADGGDAGDSDAHGDGACDAHPDSDGGDAGDDSPGDGVTGG